MTHTPEKPLPELIDPAELAPGDFLRDLGRYRPVASIEVAHDPGRSMARYFVARPVLVTEAPVPAGGVDLDLPHLILTQVADATSDTTQATLPRRPGA